MNVVNVGVAVFGGGESCTAVEAGVGWHGDRVTKRRKKEVSEIVKGEDEST